MGLDMKTRKKIYRELYKRYQKAGKKEKGQILDEYVITLGLNRDYLAHLLSNMGKVRYAACDNKPLKLIPKEPSKKQRKTEKNKKAGRPLPPLVASGRKGRPEKYHAEFTKVLTKIWVAFDFRCGKILAPFIRLAMPFLVDEFGFNEEIRALLMSVSPATIDRKLKLERVRGAIKGIGTTKKGTLLKSQIPIRLYFDYDERRPGFFELDTVSHCGGRASGQFCQTLTVTDVGSGWTEVAALLNNAHRWVKEHIEHLYTDLPFPMLGIDSDNGGEFINHQLMDWCTQNNVCFTRTRPYRKNDNCFVEQKNGDVVRKTVGYNRFEGEDARAALAEVYKHLNPLRNYWFPTFKLIAKEKLPSGRYKKIYEKEVKTPCQKLLESPDVSDESKEKLRRRAEHLNPVALQYALNEAKLRLLKLTTKENTLPYREASSRRPS
jgi:hypothetical protein